MDHDAELALWQRCEQELRSVRDGVFRMGMAGRWHIGKALDITADHALLERRGVGLDESEKGEYLARLPELISETSAQDETCETLWDDGNRPEYETALVQLTDFATGK